MPFTFAHPAAALPFVKYRKYFHIPAMMLGCMAPDFEYFLRGNPVGLYGHTVWGAVLIDLPLVTIARFICRYIIFEQIMPYLPKILQITDLCEIKHSKPLFVLIFIYSALIGIFTHIAWDSFTHFNGAMVGIIPALRETVHVRAYEIPFFKLLQHGSTLAGFIIIACFLLCAKKHPAADGRANKALAVKFFFWTAFIFITALIFALWFLLNAISVTDYGIIVVRAIDSMMLSLLLLSIALKIKVKR